MLCNWTCVYNVACELWRRSEEEEEEEEEDEIDSLSTSSVE